MAKKFIKYWHKMDEKEKQKILKNVFCSNCFVTEIVDYTIGEENCGLVLKGKCKTCGKDVARVVEGVRK
ncbi:MAG: hypothetical protein N3E50_06090 [Candidatus Goldbacteria bacterium]|nr:hypothetical protein [Candidatus Goldiibacteriota bacterium]